MKRLCKNMDAFKKMCASIGSRIGLAVPALGLVLLLSCATPGERREGVDANAYKIIKQKQMEAFGKTEPFSMEPPADTLRRRLMLAQNLPYSSPASLNANMLEPIEHWPQDTYFRAGETVQAAMVSSASGPLRLTLIDALQIAALNNRQYQTNKEAVFRAALRLDLERDSFRNTFTGSLDSEISADLSGDETQSGIANTGLAGISRKFLNGITLTGRIGLDLAKLLNPYDDSSTSVFGDASISIPLLRGAGKEIVAEPLTQAERDALYAIYTFERYKKTFAVSIASEYLSALQAIDQIDNAEANYKRMVTSTRLVRRLADAGKQSPIQVDQSIQDELSARNGWISAQISYQSRLDSLKILLGLPPDSQIELDREELTRLTESTQSISETPGSEKMEETVPPADAPVELRPLSREGAGPMELEENRALELALDNRLDLRIALGDVYDAQRGVIVAADALRAEFTLLGDTSVGERRGLGSANQSDSADLNLEKGRYNALLSLDLPIERTREIVAYRESILALERAIRDLQDTEDSVKLNVRSRLRTLQDSRASLQIQAQAVELAERRVKSTNLSLQAGRVIIRDVLEAQRALLSSQNSLTSATVRYRVAELELQRDLDVLQVDETGMWKEFSPQETEK